MRTRRRCTASGIADSVSGAPARDIARAIRARIPAAAGPSAAEAEIRIRGFCRRAIVVLYRGTPEPCPIRPAPTCAKPRVPNRAAAPSLPASARVSERARESCRRSRRTREPCPPLRQPRHIPAQKRRLCRVDHAGEHLDCGAQAARRDAKLMDWLALARIRRSVSTFQAIRAECDRRRRRGGKALRRRKQQLTRRRRTSAATHHSLRTEAEAAPGRAVAAIFR